MNRMRIVVAYLKQQYHTLAKCLKIIHSIYAALFFDMHEEGHAKDSKDEHHQEQQQTNVE